MSEVCIALGAEHLRASHEERPVRLGAHVLVCHRLGKAGPTGAGIELRIRIEQWRATAHAFVSAGLLAVVVLTGEGALGTLLARYPVLLRSELFAPLFIAFLDPVGHCVSSLALPGLVRHRVHPLAMFAYVVESAGALGSAERPLEKYTVCGIS